MVGEGEREDWSMFNLWLERRVYQPPIFEHATAIPDPRSRRDLSRSPVKTHLSRFAVQLGVQVQLSDISEALIREREGRLRQRRRRMGR